MNAWLRSRRHWLAAYAFALSGAVGLAAGWLLERLAARRGVSAPWRWAALGASAGALTALRGGPGWALGFYAALAAALGGHPPRGGRALDLAGGWWCWTLAVAAALPSVRRLLGPPHAPDTGAPPRLRGRPRHVAAGVEIGVAVNGHAVVLADREANTGVLVLGAPGSGKTGALLGIAASVLRRGLPLVFVDGKGSADLRRRLEHLAAAADRPCRVWSLTGPAHYNPLRHGGPTELRDKLIATESWTEPHYRRAAERYLGSVLRALAAAGVRPSLPEVTPLLFPDALEAFARRIPDETHARRLYAYIDSLDRSARSAVVGLGNRLATLLESEAGAWLGEAPGPPATTVDLLEAFTGGPPVLFSLDALRFPGLAAQVGALVLQDLQAVLAELLARGNGRPCYLLVDEFNVFEGRQVLALLNKGREAGLCPVLATQDLADVAAAGGPVLVDQVLANTNVKLLLRQDVDASVARLAASVGTVPSWSPTHRLRRGRPTGEGSVHPAERFALDPNLLKRLPPHQAVLVRKAPQLAVQHLRLWPPGA